MITIYNYINGKHIKPLSNKWLDLINPGIGKSFGKLADSDKRDVELAYKSAKKAFNEWSKSSIKKRSSILLKIAELIEQHVELLANAESMDNG